MFSYWHSSTSAPARHLTVFSGAGCQHLPPWCQLIISIHSKSNMLRWKLLYRICLGCMKMLYAFPKNYWKCFKNLQSFIFYFYDLHFGTSITDLGETIRFLNMEDFVKEYRIKKKRMINHLYLFWINREDKNSLCFLEFSVSTLWDYTFLWDSCMKPNKRC
jgi:hypothetical protein